MNIKEKLGLFFKDKSIAILGFGREGKSTLDILSEIGCKNVAVLDKNDVDKNAACGCTLHCGDNYLDFLKEYDKIGRAHV